MIPGKIFKNFIINKDASKLGDINNIRGIAVNSIIIKLIENILHKDLKKEINQNN